MQLTIIIPTFNESENIARLLPVLFGLPLPDLHVLVIDDNSPDGTAGVVRSVSGQYPGRISLVERHGKLGLGSAYLSGFGAALRMGAEAIAQMDADFSHDPARLVELMAALDETDVVIGSRYVPGGSVDKLWPAWRKGLSAFGNLYARKILRLPIKDATGGFRIWRRETLSGMPLQRVRSNGYAFQVEIAYIAHRLGYSFKEVPIYFADRRWGTSKMSFAIQLEAARRVWEMLVEYRDLTPRHAPRVESVHI
jgi:dolichol-phosphate mannosyltransferase